MARPKSLRNKNGKGYIHRKWAGDVFISLDKQIAGSNNFKQLSGNANKVLIWLLLQYNGYNNGDLSAPKSDCYKWGISSKTLYKAIAELEDKKFIYKTRQGLRIGKKDNCSLYAISWLELDEKKDFTYEAGAIGKIMYTKKEIAQYEATKA